MKKITTLALFAAIIGSSLAQIAGTWTLSPVETSLAVGPAKGDFGWWKVPAAEITGVRACQYDDEFVFNADGSYKMNFQGSTFVEGWMGGSMACGTPVAPFDGSGSYTYKYNASKGTVTLYGKGAFAGLPKAYNGGELSKVADAKDSITYEVSINGNNMSLDISIGGGYWHFEFVKKMPPLDPKGLWKLRPVQTSMAVGPAKGDFAWWKVPAAEITGVRACQYDDIYNFSADGTFQNELQGSTFLEGWQGGSFACGTPVAPHDGATAGKWVANKNKGTVTLIGKGSYLGLPKAYNGGELSSPANAKDTIVYEVAITADTMKVDIAIAGGAYWHFELVKTTRPVSGVKSAVVNGVVVYPNPSNGDFNVSLANGGVINMVRVMNLSGQVVSEVSVKSSNARISASALAAGAYLISVETNEGTAVQRFIKQ
ncbi:MAG: T9SS type A sorting domain-containing protein [Bacteroidota bacterium]